LIRAKRGILLHVSLNGPGPPEALTLGPQGDLRHDPRQVPWPLPDHCAHTVVVPRVLEYVPKAHWFRVLEELYRVARPGAKVYLSGLYGTEWGALQDPLHEVPIVEATFLHCDPAQPAWQRHQPKTKLVQLAFTRVPGPEGTHYNCILEARPGDDRPA
jgi:hypothetical protein